VKTTIDHRPDFALLVADLEPGESLQAEPGAMVAMDTTIELQASARGGFLESVKRMAAGESFFQSTFTAKHGSGRVLLAPGSPGDVLGRQLAAGESIMIQSSCWLASEPSVKIDASWGGAKGFFSGAGVVLLKATGPGMVWASCFGGIRPTEVKGEYVVDTGHVVAFDSGVTFTIDRVRGLKGLLFSGEGLTCRFRGNGTVWVQTRNPNAFASFLHPFRRVKQQNNS
jgi:uncharacterized protein (TIGR00266 family)